MIQCAAHLKPSYMRMNALINGRTTDVPEGSSVSDLLEQLGLGGKRIAVELNGEILPRSRHAEQRVADGDRLEIVHAIGGGSLPASNPETYQ